MMCFNLRFEEYDYDVYRIYDRFFIVRLYV